MAKIIRTTTKATGGITDQEREAMRIHAEKWIAIAYRTEPIDVGKITDAIKRLYDASNFPKPTVVVAPSPFVMALAGGFAAAIWYLRKQPLVKTHAATDAATCVATHAATRAAINAATHAAINAAIHAATDDVTHDAIHAVIDDVTHDAIHAVIDAAINAAIDDATRYATDAATHNSNTLVRYMLSCANSAMRMYQGGNMWAAWDCYLTAYRDVLGLKLPQYDKYKAWEDAAMHGGFRIMHEKFCIVSDFPEFIKVDSENRPHCEDGPSHRWRDGWSIYYWHGVRVTKQIIESPDTITAKQVVAEENQEVRRIMVERMGWDRYCDLAKIKVIHRDELRSNFPALPVTELVEPGHRLVTEYRAGTETAELLEVGELKDFDGRPLRFVRLTDPSTGRRYTLRVAHDTKTCYEGVGASFGMTESNYKSKFYLRHGDVMLKPLTDSLNEQRHS